MKDSNISYEHVTSGAPDDLFLEMSVGNRANHPGTTPTQQGRPTDSSSVCRSSAIVRVLGIAEILHIILEFVIGLEWKIRPFSKSDVASRDAVVKVWRRSPTSLEKTAAPRNVAQVNRACRAIVLRSPLLWAHIRLHDATPLFRCEKRVLGMVEERLQLSGDAPLTIIADVGVEKKSVDPCESQIIEDHNIESVPDVDEEEENESIGVFYTFLDGIIPARDRWKAVFLTTHIRSPRRKIVLDGMPRLEILSIRLEDDDEGVEEVVVNLKKSNKLYFLDVDANVRLVTNGAHVCVETAEREEDMEKVVLANPHMFINDGVHLVALQYVRLSSHRGPHEEGDFCFPGVNETYHILACAPNLNTAILVLNDPPHPDYFADKKPLVLPNLRVLCFGTVQNGMDDYSTITVRALLSCLTLPGLRSLSLKEAHPAFAVGDLLVRSRCPLEQFSIQVGAVFWPTVEQDLAGWLLHMPHLRVLHVEGISFSDALVDAFTCHSADSCLCPNLSNIYMEDCFVEADLTPDQLAAIHRMYQSRFLQGLRFAHVRHCYTEQTIDGAYLQPFIDEGKLVVEGTF